jgi:hypothetical protein
MPCGWAAHAVPQPPQSSTLSEVSTHAPLQHVAPFLHGELAEQPGTQMRPAHRSPPPQSESARHSKQVWVEMSQTGLAGAQSFLSSHPATQLLPLQ